MAGRGQRVVDARQLLTAEAVAPVIVVGCISVALANASQTRPSVSQMLPASAICNHEYNKKDIAHLQDTTLNKLESMCLLSTSIRPNSNFLQCHLPGVTTRQSLASVILKPHFGGCDPRVGPMTLKFQLRLDFCTVHLSTFIILCLIRVGCRPPVEPTTSKSLVHTAPHLVLPGVMVDGSESGHCYATHDTKGI